MAVITLTKSGWGEKEAWTQVDELAGVLDDPYTKRLVETHYTELKDDTNVIQ